MPKGMGYNSKSLASHSKKLLGYHPYNPGSAGNRPGVKAGHTGKSGSSGKGGSKSGY